MQLTKKQEKSLLKMKAYLEKWFDEYCKKPTPYIIKDCAYVYNCILHDSTHSCSTLYDDTVMYFRKCGFVVNENNPNNGWIIYLP
jgi:hypothetical protein